MAPLGGPVPFGLDTGFDGAAELDDPWTGGSLFLGKSLCCGAMAGVPLGAVVLLVGSMSLGKSLCCGAAVGVPFEVAVLFGLDTGFDGVAGPVGSRTGGSLFLGKSLCCGAVLVVSVDGLALTED